MTISEQESNLRATLAGLDARSFTEAEFRSYNNLIIQGCLSTADRATLDAAAARLTGDGKTRGTDFTQQVKGI